MLRLVHKRVNELANACSTSYNSVASSLHYTLVKLPNYTLIHLFLSPYSLAYASFHKKLATAMLSKSNLQCVDYESAILLQ